MKRNDAQFQEMVSRISSGELTRAQAAEVYQVKPGTLGVWLARSGVYSKSPDGPKKLHGAAVKWADTDPDKAKAYEEAVMKVLKGMPGAEAARKYSVNYQYLMRKVAAIQRVMEEGAARDKGREALGTRPESTRYLNIADLAADPPEEIPERVWNRLPEAQRMPTFMVDVLTDALTAGEKRAYSINASGASKKSHEVREALKEWKAAVGSMWEFIRRLDAARDRLTQAEIQYARLSGWGQE